MRTQGGRVCRGVGGNCVFFLIKAVVSLGGWKQICNFANIYECPRMNRIREIFLDVGTYGSCVHIMRLYIMG